MSSTGHDPRLRNVMAVEPTRLGSVAPVEARHRDGDAFHAVHFYDSSASLCDGVVEYLAAGLSADEGVIVVATQARLASLEGALAARGISAERAKAHGQLHVFDAVATLSQLLVDGALDQRAFDTVVRPLVDHVVRGLGSRKLRAYGEMVDLLWQRGQLDAALRLEGMWNQLQRAYGMPILCTYLFDGRQHAARDLERICAEHTHVVTTGLEPRGDEEDYARRLLSEIGHRMRIEQGLRALEQDVARGEAQRRDLARERGRAEDERDAAARRTEKLMKVTTAIADAVTTEQVHEAIVDLVAHAIGASSAGLWLLSDDALTATLVRDFGYRDHARPALLQVDVAKDSQIPAIEALVTRQPIWIDSREELVARYPTLSTMTTPGRSYVVACLPIIVHGRPLGVLGLTFDEAARWDEEERRFMMLVARYSGQALERVRLLNMERRSRERAEAAAERLDLLSRASRVFAEMGTELGGLLRTVVMHVTSGYADSTAILLTAENENGKELELVAFNHVNPDANAEFSAAFAASPARFGEGLAGRVVMTGEAVMLSDLSRPEERDAIHPVHRGWVDRYNVRSVLYVPLRARGRVLGVIAAGRESGRPPFDASDRALLEELAERAALAVESTRLYRDNQHARSRAEMLHGMVGALIRAEDVRDVFEAALGALESIIGARRSSILAYDDEGVMRFKAWRGLSDEYRAAVEGHSPWARDAKNPSPVLIEDAAADPSVTAYRELFARENIGALAFIPLVAGGRLLGKFMVYFDAPRAFTQQDLESASVIANHVATAIARFDALTELQQTVRFNEMFTGMLGHDLRNPLAAIMTSAQLALGRDASGKLARPLARILSSGDRMARMIDQLLDFTRVRVGSGIPIAPKPIDLVPIVRQVMDELEGAYPDWTLRLEPVVGMTEGVWDGDRLSQVFSNLVANALQHGIPSHGVCVRIDGSLPHVVSVAVRNAGVIPPQLVPKLFEPMAGGDRRRDGSRGLGLGLYISQEIARAHRGRITVRSDDATGTAFTLFLPRSAPTVTESRSS